MQPTSHDDFHNAELRQPLQTAGADGSGVLEYDGTFFPDFLQDVLIPNSGNAFTADLPGYLSQAYSPRGFMDYGFDGQVDLTVLNFDFLNEANAKQSEMEQCAKDKALAQEPATGVAIGAEAFQKSTLVSWTPRQRDHGFAEQANFFLPRDVAESPELQLNIDNDVLKERLNQSARDKILAMVLEGCRDTNIPNVVASFPTIEIFHSLIEKFLRWHWPQVCSWLHLPSFVVKEKKTELIAAIVAAGALRTPMPIFRKLGFALQEAVRVAIPKRVSGHSYLISGLLLRYSLTMTTLGRETCKSSKPTFYT